MSMQESSRRRLLATLVAVAATTGTALAPVHAQSAYPERAVSLVVPYPAGGPTDAAARLLATKMSEQLGQPIVVENKGGAATIVGTEHVRNARPDGYTLLFAATSTFGTNPHLYRKLPYRLADFTAISGVSKVPYVLTVAPSSPPTDARSFIEWAKTRPKGANFGSVGTGSSTHVAGVMLAKALGIELLEIPYKGMAAATTDLMGGMIDSVIETVAVQNLYAAGKVKVLGIMDGQRWPGMPEVPTFEEQGFPETNAASVYYLMAPAGVPADVQRKLAEAATKVLNDKDVKAQFLQIHHLAMPMPPEETLAFISKDSERWGKVIRELGLQLD